MKVNATCARRRSPRAVRPSAARRTWSSPPCSRGSLVRDVDVGSLRAERLHDTVSRVVRFRRDRHRGGDARDGGYGRASAKASTRVRADTPLAWCRRRSMNRPCRNKPQAKPRYSAWRASAVRSSIPENSHLAVVLRELRRARRVDGNRVLPHRADHVAADGEHERRAVQPGAVVVLLEPRGLSGHLPRPPGEQRALRRIEAVLRTGRAHELGQPRARGVDLHPAELAAVCRTLAAERGDSEAQQKRAALHRVSFARADSRGDGDAQSTQAPRGTLRSVPRTAMRPPSCIRTRSSPFRHC